jgi:hypothetical protein
MKARKGANKTTREIDDKNLTQKQFISSQAFHRTLGGRVRETTAGERFRPQILETCKSRERFLNSEPKTQYSTGAGGKS